MIDVRTYIKGEARKCAIAHHARDILRTASTLYWCFDAGSDMHRSIEQLKENRPEEFWPERGEK